MKKIAKIAVFATVFLSSIAAIADRSALQYKRITIGGAAATDGIAIVNAIKSGNWRLTKQLLNRGNVKIDDVICVRMIMPSTNTYWDYSGEYSNYLDPSSYYPSVDQTMLKVDLESLVFESTQYRRDYYGQVYGMTQKVANPTGNPMHNMYIPSMAMTVDGTDSIAYTAGKMTDGSWIELYGTPLMIASRLGNKFIVGKLLEKGANPNIFIKTGGVLHTHGNIALPKENLINCRRSFIYALADAFVQVNGKSREDMVYCANLIAENGAYFPAATKDDIGRTALWDAAILASPDFIELCIRRFNMNPDEVDNLGKTISVYLNGIGRAAGHYSNDIADCMKKLGANSTKLSEDDDTGPELMDELGPSSAPGQSTPPTNSQGQEEWQATIPGTPSLSSYPINFQQPANQIDHSAEIASLNSRLYSLRIQLEEAKVNEHNAIVQGIGQITASMIVQNIMREIQDTEKRLLELSN